MTEIRPDQEKIIEQVIHDCLYVSIRALLPIFSIYHTIDQ